MTHKFYDNFFIGTASLLIFLVGTDVYPIALGQGSFSVRLGLVTLLPMMAIVVLYFGPFLRGALAVPEISILVTLALFSAVWSYLPSNTIERAIPLLVTTAFAMTLASILSLRSLLIVFALVGALAMFGSIMAVAAIPGARGIPPWENTWNGLFNHKNGLGSGSLWAVIYTAVAVSVTDGKVRRFFIVACFLSVFMLMASESRSSQFVVLLLGMAIVVHFLMTRFVLVWAIFFLAFLMIFIATVYFLMSTNVLDPIFSSLERKPTLSGRIPLWGLVLPYIQEEFWLGYGYLGFWDNSSSRVLDITNDLGLGFTPFYSHNGLLETWLHVGFAGVFLMFAAIVRVFRASFAGLSQLSDNTLTISAFLIVIAFLLLNITEGSILSRGSISWMSFVAISTKLSLVARTIKKRPELRSHGFGGLMHRYVGQKQVSG